MHDDLAKSKLLAVYVTIACIMLMLPIAIVVALAFGDQGYLQFPPPAYSLHWFRAFFGDPRWQDAIYNSVIIAAVACVLSTAFGFLAAYAFVRSSVKAKKLLLSLMLLPIIVPSVITAIALYFLSGQLGLLGNRVWIGVCHSVIALPIVLLILLPSLNGIDINLERAALSLGGGRMMVFRRIVIPLAFPGILSAMLFAFLASFDELLIALFLTGIRIQTLPVRIWNSLLLQVEPVIAAVSVFLIGVTALVLVFDTALRRLRRSGSPSTT